MSTKKLDKYELYNQMDSDKFFDFIIKFFDNMGMREFDLPLNCSYCPLKEECNNCNDEDITCLEFLSQKLKRDIVKPSVYNAYTFEDGM